MNPFAGTAILGSLMVRRFLRLVKTEPKALVIDGEDEPFLAME
jgi:hypothetical protein